MRRTLVRVNASLALSAALCLGGFARAVEVLFYAPFDGGVDAKAAKGDPKGKFQAPRGKPDAQPVFGDGIAGKALDIGTGCRVDYAAGANVRSDRGSISFWTKRAGPRPEGRYTFNLGGWSNADGSWVLLYRWEWFSGVVMLHGRGSSGDAKLELPGDADDGNWHLIVFTWDGERARGWLDGEMVDTPKFPAQQFTGFHVGGGDSTSRLMDELRIHDEPLSPSEVKAMFRELAGVKTEPTLVIPRRTAPIKVDGKVSAEEWGAAAVTTGFIGIEPKLFAPTQTAVRALYDDEALYLVFDSALPERARKDPAMTAGMSGALRQTRDRFDTDVDNDDAVEVNVMPQWPAASPYAQGMWHRLVVNGLNTHYDYTVSDKNVISLDWNPKWESASSLDADGWHVELRLPFASFGIVGGASLPRDTRRGDAPPTAPKPGERWGLNFVRIWHALQSGREAWRVAPEGTPGYRYAVAPVVFGAPDSPIVQLSDWGPLQDNLLALRGQLLNPSQKPLAARVQVTSDSGEIKLAETLEVKPGGSAPFRLDGRLQESATAMLTFEATDAAGKAVWLRSQVPVAVRQVLEITSAHYPSAGILRVMADAGRLRSTPLKDLALSVTVLDQRGKRALPVSRLGPLPGYQCEVELDVKRLKPGKYEAKCVVEANGQQVAEKLIAYEKLAPPEWLGNRIGLTDKAPKPFTPLRREGDAIACWGREYRFGGKLLPEQITSQGSPVLAAPIELLLTDDAGAVWSSTEAPTRVAWGKATDFRIEFERGCRLGRVPLSLSCWMECDGFLWTTLRLDRCRRTVSRLVLRVPIRKEWSEYINPFDYSTVTSGKLKTDGWKGGGQPLWLGNPVGGLQFTCETLAPCRLKPDTSPLRVIPGDKESVLELTLIDTPTRLAEPFEVSWGLVATPTRPRTPGYRGWATGNADILPGYQWYVPSGTADFDPRWLGYSHFVGEKPRPDGKGKAITSGGPYVVTTACPLKVPEYAYWGDEWSPSRTGRRAEGGIGQCSVAAASWRDFFLSCYRKLYGRGRFVGLYYDCAPYLPDDNVYHGGGYREGERILPVNNILAARELTKRMYCMLRELEPDRTMILIHNSGQIDMAIHSWCDVFVDGENFTSRLSKKEQDYHRVFPVEAFLAQSMGHNFGPANWFLDEFNRSGATTDEDWKRLGIQPVTHLYGLILLHDSTYWKAYGIKEGYDRVDDALRKYHFDGRYTMIPYWSQKIVSLPEKAYATFYSDEASGTTLVVLLNNREEDLNLRLKVDWAALGHADWQALKVDDAVFEGDARIEGGELVTPIGRANMRLLAITKAQRGR
ncbi:MAG: hypothetical protein FJ291_17740 [Planctomycetes bacterium]|nr:hypothetical protein [Planctomycetota bacterium]